MVKVKFLALAHLTNGEAELILDAASILDLLDEMKKRYSKFRNRMFDPETGRLYPELIITVNGKPCYDYTTKLDSKDIVGVLPIISGG